MGAIPLAVAEFFCSSAAQRLSMEAELRSFLASAPSVEKHDPLFFEKFCAGIEPDTYDEGSGKLSASSFLTVRSDSCYGSLYIFCLNMGSPTSLDWQLSAQLGAEILNRSLCSSVMFRQGCESKGFFGKRLTPAIVASPDFAKLAALKRFEQLDPSALPEVVEQLDVTMRHERYCENKWQGLVAECKADPRFVPVITGAGR